jgi:hypothetical protein
VPGFKSCAEAERWLARSDQQLAGKQVLILRALRVARVEAQTVTKVQLKWKPRKLVHGPGLVEEAGE